MYLFRFKLYLFFCLSVLLAHEGKADGIRLGKDSVYKNISSSVWMLEDPTDQWSFDSVQTMFAKGNGQINPGNTIELGLSESSHWMKVSVKIDSQSVSPVYLQIPKSNIDVVDFYIPSKDSLKIIQTGTSRPFKSRAIVSSFFTLPLYESGDVYIKVKSITAITFPMQLVSSDYFFKQSRNYNVFNGFYLGLVCFMVIASLFYFFFMRQLFYLTYAALAFSTAMVVGYINGYNFQYLFPESVYLNNHPAIINVWAQFFFILFLIHFLEIKKYSQLLYKIALGLLATAFIQLPIDLLGYTYWALNYSGYWAMVSTAFALGISVYIYLKGYRSAIFLVLALIFLSAGVTVQVLTYKTVIDFNIITMNAMQIGSGLEMIFFSLAMVDLSYRYKVDNDKAQIEKIALMEQHQKAMRDQNVNLEKSINEKTRLLTAQNELLKMKNDELVSQSRKLREQNDANEKQNRNLIEESAKLQHDMETRTSEMIKANEQLQFKNIQLEQFAFITSHNIRGPIARMIGLTNIFDISKMDTEMNKTVIEKMKVCSAELDEIITDLTSIIAVQKGVDRIIEPVQISLITKNIINTFEQQIHDFNIDIQYDFTGADRIISVKAYIHSIIYNLLSNAIKYRNTNKQLKINIKSEPLGNDKILFTFSDNGIGMDLTRIGDKIFKPFQRFNEKLPGKGLGLYLVKTQVESLGGDIRIDSKLEEGTSFAIELPYVKM